VCGSGMANAQGAVLQALRPIAAVALPAQVRAGAPLTLDASGSAAACGAKIVSYQWSMVDPAGDQGLIKNAAQAQASLAAPSGATVYQLLLTVTDDSGRIDSAPVIVTAAMANSTAPANAGQNACLTAVNYSPPTTPPTATAAAGGSGGGGGALDLISVLAGLAAGARLGRVRYARRSAASSHSRCARR